MGTSTSNSDDNATNNKSKQKYDVDALTERNSNSSNSNNSSNNKNNSSDNIASSSFAAFHDAQTILAAYDTDGDSKLSAEELGIAIQDYQKSHSSKRSGNGGTGITEDNDDNKGRHTAATIALARYDRDADGIIDEHEVKALYTDIDTSETLLKYLAFTGSLSTMGKIVRALNAADAKHGVSGSAPPPTTIMPKSTSTSIGTGNVGPKQLQDVASQGRQFWNGIRLGLVQWSWRVTYGYVITDSLWEGYTHSLDGNYEQGARHLASRACFNTSMVFTSMYTVKYTVQLTSKILPPYLKVGPPWLVPCMLSTIAVVQIPALVAKPLKTGLRDLFGANNSKHHR